MGQRVLLRVFRESADGEQRIAVMMGAEWEIARGVTREMLIDVSDNALRIANVGDPNRVGSELRFDEQPDRK